MSYAPNNSNVCKSAILWSHVFIWQGTLISTFYCRKYTLLSGTIMPFQTVFIFHVLSVPVCGTRSLLVQLDKIPLKSVDDSPVLTGRRGSPCVYMHAACNKSYSILFVSFIWAHIFWSWSKIARFFFIIIRCVACLDFLLLKLYVLLCVSWKLCRTQLFSSSFGQ